MAFAWPQEAVAAVSLAFDGTTPAHLQLRDELAAMGLRATFYVDAPGLLEDVTGWQRAASFGHEVGSQPLLGATDADGLIARLSPEAIAADYDDFELLLEEHFGGQPHSAGLPLTPTLPDEAGLPAVPQVIQRTIVRLNQEALFPVLDERFEVIRAGGGRFNKPEVNLRRLETCRVDGHDPVSVGLIGQIAISKKAWVILSFRDANPKTVSQIAKWLLRQPVWLAPVVDIAHHLRESFSDAPTFHSV